MSFLIFIILGGLVGWGAGMYDRRTAIVVNIAVGIVGAVLCGGLIGDSLGTSNTLGVSVLGSFMLVSIVRILRPSPKLQQRRRS